MIEDVQSSSFTPGIIANNMVAGFEYSLDLTRSSNLQVTHNSISSRMEVENAVYCFMTDTVYFTNNIIRYERNPSAAYYVISLSDPADMIMDYNVYDYNSTNANIRLTPYGFTLAQQQANQNQDLNSFLDDAMFYDPYADLHTCNGNFYMAGTTNKYASQDIDGYTRDFTNPTIGAQELFDMTGKPDATFTFNGFNLFKGFSINYASTYTWDFGDGSTGNGWIVSHNYAGVGPYTVTLIARNACGADTVIQSVSVTGVDEMTSPEIILYPNPASDRIMINWVNSQVSDISIFDMQGREIRAFNISSADNQLLLDVSGFVPGIYLLRANDAKGQSSTTRFVKQ